MKYPNLLSPAKLGPIETKNRFVMTAMATGTAAADGSPTDTTVAYYRERAKGVGLIITGGVQIGRHTPAGKGYCFMNSDSYIEAYRRLTDAVHAEGTPIILQIVHPGPRSHVPGPAATPSGIPAFPHQQAYELSKDEIHELIEDFINAARRAKEAGFDGVEFHGAHNYLIHSFLSPHFNQRTDEYGGSFENRFRFLKEIFEGAREVVGPDFPLLARISADEYLPDGHSLDDGIRIAQELEKLGAVAIDLSVGGASNGRSHTIEPMTYAEGWRKHLAKAVKKMVNIPVFATTVIRHPEYAEQLLADGYMDLVASGRSTLADPYWVQKTAEGREAEIRNCISCCRCIESFAEGQVVCSINPQCVPAPEKEIVKDGNGRKAVVAGGGPAGLEAARVLGERGFSVTLFEKRACLGGQMEYASHVPYKDKMLWFIDWQARELERLGVEVKLGTAPSAEDILALNPEVVIDATGAVPIVPASIPGTDLPNVKTPVDVLTGAYLPTDKHIAVIGSGLTGLETAEVLAAMGNMVKVLEMAGTIAPGGSGINAGEAKRRLNLDNVVLQTDRQLTKIEEDRIYVTNTVTGDEYVLPVDAVILSLGVKSQATLEKELEGKCRVITVGDAAKPGRIQQATETGFWAAMKA
ncbi:MAG: FAD-dependent oxidoreductase [Firmicutes bacterium]|nr:FAD-dependent oxidoreductase [Bacillota bacterium]